MAPIRELINKSADVENVKGTNPADAVCSSTISLRITP